MTEQRQMFLSSTLSKTLSDDDETDDEGTIYTSSPSNLKNRAGGSQTSSSTNTMAAKSPQESQRSLLTGNTLGSGAGGNIQKPSPRSSLPTAGGSSSSSLSSITRGDRKAMKRTSLVEATAALSVLDEEANGLVGFDPRMWIIAAGALEKQRDGNFREGYAKRWFVLDGETLYYFLLPKLDKKGFVPLLGEERGHIRMSEVEEVILGSEEEDPCMIRMVVSQVIKVNLTLGAPVTEVKLRAASPEAARSWVEALKRARDLANRKDSTGKPVSRMISSQLLRKGSGENGFLDDNMPGRKSSEVSDASMVRDLSPGRGSSNHKTIPTAQTLNNNKHVVKRVFLKQQELDAHFPKFSKATHVNMKLALPLLALGNAMLINMPLFADHTYTISSLFTISFIFLLGFLEYIAAKHEAVISVSRRCIQDLHSEIRSSGLLPSSMFLRVVRGNNTSNRNNDDLLGLSLGDDDDDDDLKSFASTVNSPVLQSNNDPKTFESKEKQESLSIGSSHTMEGSKLFPAGSTMRRINSNCSFEEQSSASMSWFNAKGDRFKLRIGPNYPKYGKKAPSADGMYELIGMDLIKSDVRIEHVAKYTNLPKKRDVDDVDKIKQSGLPRLFIINAQIPEKQANIWGSSPEDVGTSIVFYFAIKPSLVASPITSSSSEALKLLKQFVSQWNVPGNDYRRRFKAIGMADNVAALGIPGVSGLVEKFNGKPVIIYKCGQIFQGEDYLEVDISIHQFPFIARRGLYSLRDRVPDVALRVGFVIQGESDDELPEVLLGGAEIRGMDFDKAVFVKLQ